jgi:hypothetical protein
MKLYRANGVQTAPNWQYMAVSSLIIVRTGKPMALQRADHMTRGEEKRNA